MTNQEITEKLETSITPVIKALIFDLDGTLVDSNPAHLSAWKEACALFGLTYPTEKFFYYAGLPSTMIAAEIIKTHSLDPSVVKPEDVAAAKEKAFEKYQYQINPILPVLAILKKYRGKLKTALGTGRIKGSALETLAVLHLTPLFDAVVTADDVSHFKPAPDTFLRCADLLQTKPANCLVFEDVERGLEAAKRAGMQVVNVRKWLGKEKL